MITLRIHTSTLLSTVDITHNGVHIGTITISTDDLPALLTEIRPEIIVSMPGEK